MSKTDDDIQAVRKAARDILDITAPYVVATPPEPDPDPPVPNPLPDPDPDPPLPDDAYPLPGTGGTFEISKGSVGWEVSSAVNVGRFVSGANWVQQGIGGVSVDLIYPGSKQEGTRYLNGSMVDPDVAQLGGQLPGTAQGYDSETYDYFKKRDYLPSLDAGQGWPLKLSAGQSLITTISNKQAGARPQIKNAEILTCVVGPPDSDRFRPSYVSGNKRDFWFRDVSMDALRILPDEFIRPSFDTAASWFASPWLDHVPQNIQRYIHPSENMPDYGSDMAEQTGLAALMLILDVPDEVKRPLLVNYLQLGIDLYGIAEAVKKSAESGGLSGLAARHNITRQTWPAYGGHHIGRKAPLLFAGMVFQHPGMIDICKPDSSVAFAEDDHTFFVRATDEIYGPFDLGLPEWGERHFQDRSLDNPRWVAISDEELSKLAGKTRAREKSVRYRRVTGPKFLASALAFAAMPGGRDRWGHDAYFKYASRYRETEPQFSKGPYLCANKYSDQWPLKMWDRHAGSLGL